MFHYWSASIRTVIKFKVFVRLTLSTIPFSPSSMYTYQNVFVKCHILIFLSHVQWKTASGFEISLFVIIRMLMYFLFTCLVLLFVVAISRFLFASQGQFTNQNIAFKKRKKAKNTSRLNMCMGNEEPKSWCAIDIFCFFIIYICVIWAFLILPFFLFFYAKWTLVEAQHHSTQNETQWCWNRKHYLRKWVKRRLIMIYVPQLAKEIIDNQSGRR